MAGSRFDSIRAFLILTTVALLGSCQSARNQVDIIEPPLTFIPHLDRALQLATGTTEPIRVQIFTQVASSLAASGRVEAAADVLLSAESIPLVLGRSPEEDDTIAELRAGLAVAWHRIAARDETRAVAVDRRTVAVLGVIRDRTQADADATHLLVEILAALIGNENASDDVFRRTIDQLYLINSDIVRAQRLVEAAELIDAANQIASLNPVVQQAIATVPALGDAMVAADLSARLAVLSDVLNRPRDVTMLLDRVVNRAGMGLAVDETGYPRLERMIDTMTRFGRPDDARAIASNVSPVSARARALAFVGAAAANAAAMDEALVLVAALGDPETRLTAGAAIVRLRALSFPDWDPSDSIIALLGDVRMASLPAEARERALADFSAAYIATGQVAAETRLRGLISSQDEYARVSIGAAEVLFEAGLRDGAATLLRRVERIPATAVGLSSLPASRAASLWRDLGEYDRVVQVAESLDTAAFALTIARIPADFVPEPSTVGILNRRAIPAQ